MTIRWLPQAADELDGIHNYLVEYRRERAYRNILEVYEAVEFLGRTLFRGKPGREPGTREFVLPRLPHIIFYRISDES